MSKTLKYVLMGGGGLLVALVAVMTTAAVLFGGESAQLPISTFEAGDRKILVYAPGKESRTYVTTSNAAEGQIIVRNRKIVMRRDGAVHLDGQKLDLIGYTELEILVHPDQRVETRVLKARSGDDPLAQRCCTSRRGNAG